MSIGQVVVLGLGLGLQHAVDPDHVVAVSTIVSRTGSAARSIGAGALWGVDHTLTVLAVGGAMVLFSWKVPASWTHATNLAVALMLIALGLSALRAAKKASSNHTKHQHFHAGQHSQHDRGGSAVRALAVGMVHGLAGSAGIALLALSAVQEQYTATAFLTLFGLGTIAGMVLITAIISLPFAWGSQRSRRLVFLLRRGVGLLSLVFGIALVITTLREPSAQVTLNPNQGHGS